jgi:sulfite reductase (NADPH) flavoprotein alpha-component
MSIALPSAAPGDCVASSASEIIESLAVRHSNGIYLYDTALQHGVGALAKLWKQKHTEAPHVVEAQTRSGAGLSLVGRLSEGTSVEGSRLSFILTAFTTPDGLAEMLPALSTLPPATTTSRVVVGVPAVSAVGDSFALSPTLAPVVSMLPTFSEHWVVIASATPQESADMASIAYATTGSHVIHFFDHFAGARELRKLTYPSIPDTISPSVSIQKAMQDGGYTLFQYFGPENATDVVVAINGPFSQTIKTGLAHSQSTGIILVRVLRPWDNSMFHAVLPTSAERVHVFDDVANTYTEGLLYRDVLQSFLLYPRGKGIRPFPSVKSLRVTPESLQRYLENPSLLDAYVSKSIPNVHYQLPGAIPGLKKLAFYSSPSVALDGLPLQIVQPFLDSKSITARLLSVTDTISKLGGVSFTRVLLESTPSQVNTPIDILLPIGDQGPQNPASLADFTGILDPALLKTQNLFRTARPGSPVLIYTSWTPEEVVSNLLTATKALALQRDLRIFTFDPSRIPTLSDNPSSVIQKALAHTAFLRLYIGADANEDVLSKVSKALLGSEVEDTPIETIVERACSDLLRIPLPEVEDPTSGKTGKATPKAQESIPLQSFQFNTVSLGGSGKDAAEARYSAPTTSAWYEAAKHVMFKEAFSPAPSDPATEEPPNLSALRPELSTETYLVMCTVNKRLTPKSYNRNVFHMEFDTTGTGLTYRLGEALGVHGWNDTEEVLQFCRRYGANPDDLISVPLPLSSRSAPQRVTRTVFQVLQQQLDIFGKPSKSFFARLATFAKDRREEMALQFIASPEGAHTLKKLNEVDTVSYADVLWKFPSARPSIEELVTIVEEIKERHYSIASAQSVVGDRVDLLVVTVDWVTPDGGHIY